MFGRILGRLPRASQCLVAATVCGVGAGLVVPSPAALHSSTAAATSAPNCIHGGRTGSCTAGPANASSSPTPPTWNKFTAPSSTALIVVDCQPCFYSENEALRRKFPHVPRNVARLIKLARGSGVKVVHVHAEYNTDVSPWLYQWLRVNAHKKSTDVHPEPSEPWAAPVDGESVVVKHTVNGFYGTGLEKELQRQGITHVVVCGLVTSICVQGTANGGLERGFAVGVVPECCGDHTPLRHNGTMGMYGDYMYDLMTVDEIETTWTASRK